MTKLDSSHSSPKNVDLRIGNCGPVVFLLGSPRPKPRRSKLGLAHLPTQALRANVEKMICSSFRNPQAARTFAPLRTHSDRKVYNLFDKMLTKIYQCLSDVAKLIDVDQNWTITANVRPNSGKSVASSQLLLTAATLKARRMKRT